MLLKERSQYLLLVAESWEENQGGGAGKGEGPQKEQKPQSLPVDLLAGQDLQITHQWRMLRILLWVLRKKKVKVTRSMTSRQY